MPFWNVTDDDDDGGGLTRRGTHASPAAATTAAFALHPDLLQRKATGAGKDTAGDVDSEERLCSSVTLRALSEYLGIVGTNVLGACRGVDDEPACLAASRRMASPSLPSSTRRRHATLPTAEAGGGRDPQAGLRLGGLPPTPAVASLCILQCAPEPPTVSRPLPLPTPASPCTPATSVSRSSCSATSSSSSSSTSSTSTSSCTAGLPSRATSAREAGALRGGSRCRRSSPTPTRPTPSPAAPRRSRRRPRHARSSRQCTEGHVQNKAHLCGVARPVLGLSTDSSG